MKLHIQITRHIDDLNQGRAIFESVQKQFANDDLIHVNCIADHNYKHPEPPDPLQIHNPYSPQNQKPTGPKI